MRGANLFRKETFFEIRIEFIKKVDYYIAKV